MSFVSNKDDGVDASIKGGLTFLSLPSNLDQLNKNDVLNILKSVISKQLDQASEPFNKEELVNNLERRIMEFNNKLSVELTKQTKKRRLNNNNDSTCTPQHASSAPVVVFDVIGSKECILKNATSFVTDEENDVAACLSDGSPFLSLPSNLDQLDRKDVLNILKSVVSKSLDNITDEFDKEDLVSLVKEHNNDLSAELTNKTKKQRLNNNNESTEPSSEPELCDVIGSKKSIFESATLLIKYTTHNDNAKPYTSWVFKNIPEDSIMPLMQGCGPITKSNAVVRWILDKEEVLDWLHIRDTPHIHPVATDMKTYTKINKTKTVKSIEDLFESNYTTSKVYVHAGIEKLDIKWERKSGNLTLKFCTKIVAIGDPKDKESYKDTPPWSKPIPASEQPWSRRHMAMTSRESPPFDVIGTKKRILKNATAQIKKTVHTNNSKPYTSSVDNVDRELEILALMNGYEPKTDHNDLMRWILNDEEVLDWLNIRDTPTIHPVEENMTGYVFAVGFSCNVYVHAGIESVDIKWSRKSGTLNLKFRTFVAGTGRSFLT